MNIRKQLLYFNWVSDVVMPASIALVGSTVAFIGPVLIYGFMNGLPI